MFQRLALLTLLMPAVSTLAYAQDASDAVQSAGKPHQPTLTPQKSGTTQLLIAVSPVNERVVWASGTGGTFTHTTDGGATWTPGVVPGAEALQFRDVQGISDKVAYLMSIGDNTTDFRIYKTEDAGAHWSTEFTNHTTNAFYDCFSFWTPDRGFAHSDSVSGTFPDIATTNGRTWHSIANDLPPALPAEASFSSSGTCSAVQGLENGWVATGGSTIARILATRDGGHTWNAYDTPLRSNASAGGFSVAFRDPLHGIVGGGDLASDNYAQAAVSEDGGGHWTLTPKPPTPGAIFGLAYARPARLLDRPGEDPNAQPDAQPDASPDWYRPGPNFDRTVVVTTETLPDFAAGAAAWSPDEGHTWHTLSGVSGYWSVAFANPHAGWFVGNNGQILKISF